MKFSISFWENFPMYEEHPGIGSAVLIHWTNVGTRTGRRVWLDRFLRVKYSVPFLVPSESFATHTMLLPDVGQKMWKVTLAWREKLNSRCYRLIQLRELLHNLSASDVVSDDVTSECCLVCAQDKLLDCSSDKSTQCSICLHAFHKRCFVNIR